VLIDAGNPGGRDAGRIHKVATEVAGLKRIDHLLLTHFHVDHFGGVAELAKLMPIGTLHERDLARAPEGEQRQATLEPYKTAAVEKRELVKAGPLALRQAGATPLQLEVLGRDGRFESAAAGGENPACRRSIAKGPDPSDNRNSVGRGCASARSASSTAGTSRGRTSATSCVPRIALGPSTCSRSSTTAPTQQQPGAGPLSAAEGRRLQQRPSQRRRAGSFAAVQSLPSVQAIYQVHRSVRWPAANTPGGGPDRERAGGVRRQLHQALGRAGRKALLAGSAVDQARQSYATRAAADVARAAGRVEVVAREPTAGVDVAIDGAPFTAYLWPSRRPSTCCGRSAPPKGTEVTRGYPARPAVGDKVDHPPPRRPVAQLRRGQRRGLLGQPRAASAKQDTTRHGAIVHKKIVEAKSGDVGKLTVAADWVMPDGSVALEETTAFAFQALPDGRLIERTTTLRAKSAVHFKDTKEGMFGLRVARWLEQPASPKEKGAVIGKDYKPIALRPLDNNRGHRPVSQQRGQDRRRRVGHTRALDDARRQARRRRRRDRDPGSPEEPGPRRPTGTRAATACSR
jgi:hypothetical protein